jgi:hypothetical protein
VREKILPPRLTGCDAYEIVSASGGELDFAIMDADEEFSGVTLLTQAELTLLL